MSSLETLKKTKSLHDLAFILGYKPARLAYILYRMPEKEKYSTFSIPKKSGGTRQIKAPCEKLKLLQKRLASLLYECDLEIRRSKSIQFSRICHSFHKKGGAKLEQGNSEKNKSDNEHCLFGIHSNAKKHKNKRYVMNIDLKDFFPSFNFGRVRGFFIKNKEFNLSPGIATIIAQIACHDNELPQGSPCSPIISNFIAHILDIDMIKLAKKRKCSYSRYVDDITFSTNQRNFPKELACKANDSQKHTVGDELKSIIEKSGFKVNSKKTRLQYCFSRQSVTGLVVNRKVNIKKEYYRYARAMCHSLFLKGEFFFPASQEPGKLSQLEGRLSYIYFTKGFGCSDFNKKNRKEEKEKARKDHVKIERGGISELYRKFLYYRYFIALKKPLILCEGKTDSVYLKCAVQQLFEKKEDFCVNFFNHSDRAKDVMKIHEGVGAIKNFITYFLKETKFTHNIGEFPVIILLDNDHETQGVVKFLKNEINEEGVVYDRCRNFSYHVKKNLYLTILPNPNKEEANKEGKEFSCCIEDFFDNSVLSRKIGEKYFSKDNHLDETKCYGKTYFSRLVKADKNDIDFSKFKVVLDNISNIVKGWSDRIKCNIQ